MAGIEDEEDYDFDPEDNMSEMTPLTQHRSALSLRNELEGAQRRELTEDKVRSLYQSLELEPPETIYPDDFELKDNHLYFRNDKGERVPLTYKLNSSKFVSIGTINQKLSASERNRLGFTTQTKLDEEAVAKLHNIKPELPTDNQMQNMPLEDLNKKCI